MNTRPLICDRFVGIKMPAAVLDRLDELAETQQITRSEMVRRLIDQATEAQA